MDLIAKVVHILIYNDIIFTTLASIIEDGFEVPTFIQEPSSKLIFSNNTGSQISCAARGNPTPLVTWVLKDGSIVNSVPGLRQTPGNGTLYFPPFLGQYFRADVHEAIYRCRASNPAGTILSRDVYVRAVINTPYDIWVDGKEVFMGNVAFLRCFIPDHVKDYVSATSWYRDDELLLPELSDIGGRYIVTSGNGDLYIRSIKYDDNLKSISCLTTNILNGQQKRSESTQLSIKEITTNMAPRTNQRPIIDIHVDRGNDIHLPCNIQGNPLPMFTWFRLSDNGNIYPVPSSQRIIPSQSILLIKNADLRDSGKWICKASNQFGDQKVEIRLYVNTYLSAHIHPQIQIVNSGGTAIFNCSITGTAIENVEWFHDGTMIIVDNAVRDQKIKMLTPTSIIINRVGRDDKGIYQCLISNKISTAQAMAVLKLGDIIPELIHTFIEQNIHPGQHISLKCSAAGSPPPQFTWSLDSQPIMDVSSLHRYAIGQFVDTSGDVISHLNISSVRSDDGGLYKCVATNTIGNIEYAARLNVYGPPYVRATGPIKVIAASTLIMHCPYSGYPIESIRWEKSRIEIISNARYEVESVSKGGYLKINQVDSGHDSGTYTCIVRSEAGEEARRDIQLIVNSPPVIEAFSFPRNLQEGGRAQVTCSVSSGDMPVYFSWKKDGSPISMNLQITEKKDEFFTLLVFKDITSRHSGKYTCYATNSAATVNFTSELLVRVIPKWIAEPKDTAIMLGSPLTLNCQADGYPEPTITWFKGNGKASKEFKSILLKNNSLIIDFATELDEGFYMCQASNGIGTGLKKIIHINVNEPARFDNPMKNISSKRNDPVTLSCLAKGDEPINILWSHNNARIDLNNYRLNIAEMKAGDGINSQLSISRTDRQDSGIYKCTAENSFGKSEHIIYLAVQERPDIPSSLEIIEVSSRSVKLSWRRPFDGNSPVLSYIVQYKQLKFVQAHSSILNMDNDWNNAESVNITLPKITETRSLDGDLREKTILTGLQPSTTYLLRMLAVNEIERSAYTEEIVIKTQEEAPTEAPQNVQVQTGNPGELIVTWQLPNKDSWNGELLGFTINCSEDTSSNSEYVNQTISKLIKIDGWATTITTIRNLNTYRKYAICIRAINNFGSGPWSSIVYGTTMEGVPEAAPRHVNCTSISSQSIKISWQEPYLQYHGGILQGYKILYTPLVEDIDISSNNEVKRTSNLETYLHALYKATNYSIRVLAFTSYGDGISSNPVYCRTEEDVPEPPANIKAVALTADSILVAWLPPKHKNGHILQYTVYCRETEKRGQPNRHIIRVDEYGHPVTFQARNLKENKSYDFWVSASTTIGEGEPTSVITQLTVTRAPAKIASFSQIIRKPVGNSLLLECMAVGNPTPRAKWFTRDRPVTYSPFYEITTAGHLKIHSVEPSLSGNYTCTAKNLFGEDQVIYRLIAMKQPNPPQINVEFSSSNNIRVRWETADDGGAPIQSFTISYRTLASPWYEIELTPEKIEYTIGGLKCGTLYIIKMSANNRVGNGHSTDEINVWTKGKKPQEPEQQDLIVTNATCINLKLSSWNNGGCTIFHFSIEHRPLGDIRWTVVSSDISNSEESRHNLIFCDLLPATWYQLRISATNEGGKTTALYNFATTNMLGERIPTPDFFPENDSAHDISSLSEQSDWLPTIIVSLILFITAILLVLIIKHRGTLCGPITDGYESRTIPIELKDDHDNRRNQVYTASPVKTVDKNNDSEMYEISPYATFSVSGGRTPSSGHVKTPTRGVTTSTLDYTVQFKTFGHPEGDLNATAYPILPSSGGGGGGGGGFGHIKGKSSWPNQRYYNTDDDSTLSKSMTVKAGHSQIQSSYRNKTIRDCNDSRSTSRSKSRNDIVNHPDTESDTSGSPTNEFSNASTYRVPIKSSREMFQPDSSTESNNDHSPVEKRSCTPRHVINDVRSRSKLQNQKPRESQSMDILRSGCNNR